MKSPEEILSEITGDSLYQDWQKQHPKSYLTHFFVQISSQFELTTVWEVGFFAEDKITVFSSAEHGVVIKPADDVFKKEAETVEQLVMRNVNMPVEEAIAKAKESLPLDFPHEQAGDGFLILQTLQGKTVWNFTLITRSLKFINIKIDAAAGREIEHQIVEVVRKDMRTRT